MSETEGNQGMMMTISRKQSIQTDGVDMDVHSGAAMHDGLIHAYPTTRNSPIYKPPSLFEVVRSSLSMRRSS